MFAKIIGAIMLVLGIGLAFTSLWAVVAGVFAFIVVAVKVALVALLLYVAWRLINAQSVLAKILGAFLLVGGIGAAFYTVGTVVGSIILAALLAVKLIVTAALLYFGWRWLKTGEFSAPSRSELRGSGF